MTEVSRNDIGGDWVERPHVTGDINPSNIDDVVGRFVDANSAPAPAAIQARTMPF